MPSDAADAWERLALTRVPLECRHAVGFAQRHILHLLLHPQHLVQALHRGLGLSKEQIATIEHAVPSSGHRWAGQAARAMHCMSAEVNDLQFRAKSWLAARVLRLRCHVQICLRLHERAASPPRASPTPASLGVPPATRSVVAAAGVAMSGLSGRLALRKPPAGPPLQQVSDGQIEQGVLHLGSKPAGVSSVLAGAPPAAAPAAPLQQAGSSGKKRKAEELSPLEAAAPAAAAQAAAVKDKADQGGGRSRRAAAGKKPAAQADSGGSWSSGDEEEASKGAFRLLWLAACQFIVMVADGPSAVSAILSAAAFACRLPPRRSDRPFD